MEKYAIFIELSIKGISLSALRGNNYYENYYFRINIGNVQMVCCPNFSLNYNSTNTLISWSIQRKKGKLEMILWWTYFRNKNVDILFITHDAVLWQPPSAISNNLFQNCSLVSEKKMPQHGVVIATKFLLSTYIHIWNECGSF